MAFQETTRTSYGSKVKNSFQGILWGIILIIAGTIVLWWNEGRALKAAHALKDFEKNYVELTDINTVDPAFEGKAVHATGVATTTDTLRDAAFGIAVNAMKIARTVEYYQWTEQSESESKDKLGGSTETTTTYTYEPAWCDEPVNSNGFKDPAYKGKNFVLRSINDEEQIASNVTFGAYRLTPSIVGSISGEEPAYPSLTEAQQKQLLANVADTTVVVTVSGDQVYIGANPASPQIGDVRITFTQVTSPKTISLLQKVVNGTFESYIAKNGKAFSKVEMGTVSAVNMIEHQKSANKMTLWLLRILGIIIVIAGFRGLVSFISTVFAVVPFVQRIIGTGTNLVATLVGLVWSFVVIAIAWAAHRPVLAIALLAAAAALIFWLVSRSRKKKRSDVAALLVILLMIGAGCTGQVKGGGSDVASSDINAGTKGPVKTISVTTFYGEGEAFPTIYEYDESGKLVSEKEVGWDEEYSDGIIESLSEKDAQGRYTKEVYGTSENEIYAYNLYEFDADGRVIRSEYRDGEGKTTSVTHNTYDSAGKLLRTDSRSLYGSYGAVYEYDENGRTATCTSLSDDKVTNITTYRYDDAGREILRTENMISLDRVLNDYSSYGKNDEIIGTTVVVTDSEGTRITHRDTTFTDKNGMRHQRSYYNYDTEKTCESTFNKQDCVTHYEYFEGNSSQPTYVMDFTYGPDGRTLRQMSWKKMLLGQVKESKVKTFREKTDTFGNWTERALGPGYNFDMEYMDLASFDGLIGSITREITYRGDDQGHNYGYTAKTESGAQIKISFTDEDDVLFGDMTIDGNTYRAVGTWQENGDQYFVALQPDGDIPWSLSVPAGEGKREGTLFKGSEEIKVSLNPTRDGLKTYNATTNVDEIVGIYKFDYPGDLRSGQMNVWRNGENMDEFHFEILNTASGRSMNMASDEFEDYPGDNTVIYRYLWNDDMDESYRYEIHFFDNFAVITRGTGNANAFFGFGTSIEGIYAKLPAVG